MFFRSPVMSGIGDPAPFDCRASFRLVGTLFFTQALVSPYGAGILRRYRIGISTFVRSPAISETEDGSYRRSPLADLCVGAGSFADKTLCRRVGHAWRGRLAAEGRVAFGKPVPKQGILKLTQM